jgi:hypothetical protein
MRRTVAGRQGDLQEPLPDCGESPPGRYGPVGCGKGPKTPVPKALSHLDPAPERVLRIGWVTTLSEEGGMQVAFYDWTTYWTGALEKGQGSLPSCVLQLLEAARDDDYEDFAAQARSIPYLELTVAQIIFERIEELHREEPGLDRPAEAIAELVDMLVSEEANRNAA